VGGQAKARGIPYEQALAERIATIPAGRIGNAEDFGSACAWLCSAQAGFVTGQNLLIDGGAYPGTF
jgi:3-oxoacyl-[acyl-carrier protein] reductase